MPSPDRQAFERWMSAHPAATLEEAFGGGYEASPPVGAAPPKATQDVIDGLEHWAKNIIGVEADPQAACRAMWLYAEVLRRARHTVGGERARQLIAKWAHESYTNDDAGVAAAAALRQCTKELEEALGEPATPPGLAPHALESDGRLRTSMLRTYPEPDPAPPRPDVQTAVSPEAIDEVLADPVLPEDPPPWAVVEECGEQTRIFIRRPDSHDKVLVARSPKGKPIITAIVIPMTEIWMVSKVGPAINERKFQESSGGNIPVTNFQRCSRPPLSKKTKRSTSARRQLSKKATRKIILKR